MNIDINNIYKLCYCIITASFNVSLVNNCEVDRIHEVFNRIADAYLLV